MRPIVALLPWGLLLEDFLDPSGLTLEEFCGDFTGSWIFGYADALDLAGVDTLIVAVTSKVSSVTRVRHSATGVSISLLPTPRRYRELRKRMSAPYGRSVEEVFGSAGKNPLSKAALSALKELAPYLATPLRSLVQELKSRGCAAVLCQEYEFPLFDVCVATQRLHKLPVFGVFQGGDYRRWRIEGAIRPRTVRAAAGLIVPSVAERTRVAESYPGSRAEAIPNPVDLSIWRPREKERAREELGIRPGAVVVAWHGRVQMWKKGLDVLVDAWAELSRPGDLDAHLLLIGGGGDAADLSQRLGDHQITDFTWIDRYVHAREEIAEMLAAADIYAFPSRHEGFPVAPLEAMACGLPVVAADVSGIRDVIGAETGSGGILVPVADVASLAAGLRNLVVDPEIRRLKGLAARAQAESYGTAAIGAALRRLLVDR